MVGLIRQSLIIHKDVMRDLLKDNKVEDVLRSCLQLLLQDDTMGDAVFEGFVSKTLNYKERWENYRFSATLMNIRNTSEPEAVRRLFFDAIITLRYETILQKTSFRFISVPSIEEFNVFICNDEYEMVWLLPPHDEFLTLARKHFISKK